MQWVAIQLKGTGNWRIAYVREDWSQGDLSHAPKADELFDTQAEAEAECEKRNYPAAGDDDSN